MKYKPKEVIEDILEITHDSMDVLINVPALWGESGVQMIFSPTEARQAAERLLHHAQMVDEEEEKEVEAK